MFNWLFDMFGRDEGYYKPKKRRLYKYFDGERKVTADPMVLFRRLMERSTELSCDIQVYNSPSKDRFKAREAMMDKVRWIFSLKKYEEGGLEEEKCEELLDHFVNWCDKVKKKLRTSQTSQTVTSSPSKTSLEGNQPTKNFLGSGLTDQGTNIEKPSFTPSVSE